MKLLLNATVYLVPDFEGLVALARRRRALAGVPRRVAHQDRWTGADAIAAHASADLWRRAAIQGALTRSTACAVRIYCLSYQTVLDIWHGIQLMKAHAVCKAYRSNVQLQVMACTPAQQMVTSKW